jgi:hypothetical protein
MLLLLACTNTAPPPIETPDPSGQETQTESDEPVDTGPWWSAPAACGDEIDPGTVPGLTRWPYFQSTTTTSVSVVWGGESDSELGDAAVSRDGAYADPKLALSWLVPIDKDRTQFIRLYQATFRDLEPGTEYCVQVSVDGEILAKGMTIRTAPASPEAEVKFIAVGDMGTGSPAQFEVHDQMLAHAEGVDLFITLGDNAYGDGDYDELEQKLFRVYRDLWTGMTVFTNSGNHDYRTDNAAPYLSSFVLPRNAWREGDEERYYTTVFGPLQLVMLDTEKPNYQVSADAEDDQMDWLRSQLANPKAPWVVPTFHKPVLSGHESRDPDILALQFFVPLFDEFNVPLVLQGHNHFYERFEPVVEASVPDPDGTVYIVSGGGGAGVYDFHEDYDSRSVAVQENHFLLGTVTECTLSVRAIDRFGDEIDSFTLNRCE